MGAGSASLGWRVIWRQLRSQPAVVASIAATVLISATMLAAAPRMFQRVSSQDLHATVSDPAPAQRNMRVERISMLGAGTAGDPMGAVRRFGDSFAATEVPPAVAAITSGHGYLVDSAQFAVAPLPGEAPPHPFAVFMRFRYQEHIEENIELVAGSMPTRRDPVRMLIGDDCPADGGERRRLTELIESGKIPAADADVDCQLGDVPHYEVAVSAPTAADMGLAIGQGMLLRPDPSDRLFLGIGLQALEYQMVMSISGIIELTDPTVEYWYGDTSLHRPAIRETADLRIIRATGLMSPADYGSLLNVTGEASWQYTWRHFVDAELVSSADIETLQAELIPFEQRYTPVVARPDAPRVITQLSDLLAEHVEQRNLTLALLSVAAAGLFGVVVATILLLAILMTTRQRRSIVLTRNRGASGGQLLLTRGYQALMLSVPAGVVGYLLAGGALPGTDHLSAYRITVALVAAITVALVSAVVSLLRVRLGSLQSADPPDTTRASHRQVVLEILVVGVAAAAVVLLRRRGEAETTPAPVELDLLLAVTPILFGVAVGLVVLRLYPSVIRFLAWLGSTRPGVVAFVGFRRVQQQPPPLRLSVLVILLCVATATYSSVMGSSVEEGQVISSWQEVGADYAVKGFGPNVNLPGSVDVATLGPIDTIAFGTSFPNARVGPEQGGTSPTEVLAIDAVAYDALAHDRLGNPALPSFMFADPTEATGTQAEPIEVIISSQLSSEYEVGVGDGLRLQLGRLAPYLIVGEVRNRYPDIPADRNFVVMGSAGLQAMSGQPLTPTVAYLRADRGVGAELETKLAEQAGSARLVSRYDVLDLIAEDPYVSWSLQTFSILFVASALFAAIAATSSLAISSSLRRRDLAHLRTMGLDERQSSRMTIIEQLPPTLVGTVIGVLVGVGTALLLRPALNLDPLTGNLVPTELAWDWPSLGALVVGVIGAIGVGVVIFVAANRRTELGQILRVGEE